MILGTGVIRLVLASRNVTSGIDEISGKFQTLGNQITAFGTRVGIAASVVSGALVKFGEIGAQFERSMSQVEAVTARAGDTAISVAARMDMLGDKARELGATTRYTASEVAEGMKFLAMAGLNAQQIYESIGPVLNLAAAGAISVGQAADISTNIMTAFRIEASQLSRVMDRLAGVASMSNTNILEVGEAMKYAAPAAYSFNVSLEETLAALGKLADSGMKGCFKGDTEVLIRRNGEVKWVYWPEAKETDEFASPHPITQEIEWQLPTRMIKYRHTGKMYHVRNSNVDLVVTPDHRMWVKPDSMKDVKKLRTTHNVTDGTNLGFRDVRAENLFGKKVRYRTGGLKWLGKDVKTVTLPGYYQNRGSHEKYIKPMKVDAEVWAKFLGWYVSEGSSDYRKGNYRVRISQNPGLVRDEMREVLNQLPCSVHECKSGFNICNEQIWKQLQKCGGKAPTKKLPKYVFKWSSRLLELVYTAITQGDGDEFGNLYTTSEKLRDQVQTIALMLGYSTSVKDNQQKGDLKWLDKDARYIQAKHDGYKVNIRKQNHTPWFNPSDYTGKHAERLKKKSNIAADKDGFVGEKWEKFDDDVFCAEVPNTLLVVRRNGKVVISGNSMAGTALAQGLVDLGRTNTAAQKKLKALGLEIEDVSPKFNTLIGIIENLEKKSFDGLDFTNLVEARSARALINLYAIGSKELRKFTDNVILTNGRAAEMAKTMENNTIGSLIELKSILQAIAEIGFQSVVDRLGNLITRVKELATTAKEWTQQNQELVGRILTTTGVVSALGVAFAAVVVPLGILIASTAQVVSFVGLAAAGIANLGPLVAGLTSISAPLLGVVASLKALGLSGIIAGISSGLVSLKVTLAALFASLSTTLIFVSNNLAIITGFIAKAGLLASLKALGATLAVAIVPALKAIGAVVAALMVKAIAIVAPIGAIIAIGLALAKNFDVVKTIAMQLFEYLKSAVTGVVAGFMAVYSGFIKPTFEFLTNAIRSLLLEVSKLIDNLTWLQPILKGMGFVIGSVLAAAIGLVIGALGSAIYVVKGVVWVINKVIGGIGVVIGGIKDLVMWLGKITGASKVFSYLADTMFGWVGAVKSSIEYTNKLNTALEKQVKVLKDVGDKFQEELDREEKILEFQSKKRKLTIDELKELKTLLEAQQGINEQRDREIELYEEKLDRQKELENQVELTEREKLELAELNDEYDITVAAIQQLKEERIEEQKTREQLYTQLLQEKEAVEVLIRTKEAQYALENKSVDNSARLKNLGAELAAYREQLDLANRQIQQFKAQNELIEEIGDNRNNNVDTIEETIRLQQQEAQAQQEVSQRLQEYNNIKDDILDVERRLARETMSRIDAEIDGLKEKMMLEKADLELQRKVAQDEAEKYGQFTPKGLEALKEVARAQKSIDMLDASFEAARQRVFEKAENELREKELSLELELIPDSQFTERARKEVEIARRKIAEEYKKLDNTSTSFSDAKNAEIRKRQEAAYQTELKILNQKIAEAAREENERNQRVLENLQSEQETLIELNDKLTSQKLEVARAIENAQRNLNTTLRNLEDARAKLAHMQKNRGEFTQLQIQRQLNILEGLQEREEKHREEIERAEREGIRNTKRVINDLDDARKDYQEAYAEAVELGLDPKLAQSLLDGVQANLAENLNFEKQINQLHAQRIQQKHELREYEELQNNSQQRAYYFALNAQKAQERYNRALRSGKATQTQLERLKFEADFRRNRAKTVMEAAGIDTDVFNVEIQVQAPNVNPVAEQIENRLLKTAKVIENAFTKAGQSAVASTVRALGIATDQLNVIQNQLGNLGSNAAVAGTKGKPEIPVSSVENPLDINEIKRKRKEAYKKHRQRKVIGIDDYAALNPKAGAELQRLRSYIKVGPSTDDIIAAGTERSKANVAAALQRVRKNQEETRQKAQEAVNIVQSINDGTITAVERQTYDTKNLFTQLREQYNQIPQSAGDAANEAGNLWITIWGQKSQQIIASVKSTMAMVKHYLDVDTKASPSLRETVQTAADVISGSFAKAKTQTQQEFRGFSWSNLITPTGPMVRANDFNNLGRPGVSRSINDTSTTNINVQGKADYQEIIRRQEQYKRRKYFKNGL